MYRRLITGIYRVNRLDMGTMHSNFEIFRGKERDLYFQLCNDFGITPVRGGCQLEEKKGKPEINVKALTVSTLFLIA